MIDLLILFISALIILWALYHLALLLIPKSCEVNDLNASIQCSSLKISIIVPYKRRHDFLSRFLENLRDIEDRELLEFIFVGAKPNISFRDGIFNGVSVKFVEDSHMAGKPLALKQGFQQCSGNIVGVMDVDTILPKDFIRRVVNCFSRGVKVIQCRTVAVNSEQSIISHISSIEEYAFHMLAENRNRLNLFTPLTGNCYFILRDMLAKVGLWSNVLTEDIDLSIKLLRHGVAVKYEPNIIFYQEVPPTLKALIKQRFRWYRGYIESLLKHFRHMPLGLRGLDLMMLLSGPVIMALSLINFILALFLAGNNVIPQFITTLYLTSFITVAFYLHSLKRRIPLYKWMLTVFPYWIMQGALSILSIIFALLRIKYNWVETDKFGYVDSEIRLRRG